MTHLSISQSTQQAWHQFLEVYEPLRSELYRYCRYLTRSPWDAEDLVQDALARAFATLARMGQEAENPRAWLFRIASNLWIDQQRHAGARKRIDRNSARSEDAAKANLAAVSGQCDPRFTREAAGTLIVKLAPQERAAVLLKDVFDFSLEETASALGASVGAIKSALHRARGKLIDEPAVSESAVSKSAVSESAQGAVVQSVIAMPAALDAFCTAFNAGDLEALVALLLDTAVVEVVGATTQYGPEAARRTVLNGMLFGVSVMADLSLVLGVDVELRKDILLQPPRVEARLHRGRWLLLHWYQHQTGEAVRAITTLSLEEGRVARLENYFYNPEFLLDVCGELGAVARHNGSRWWLSDGQNACRETA